MYIGDFVYGMWFVGILGAFFLPSFFASTDPPPGGGVVPGWAGTQTHIVGTPPPGSVKTSLVPGQGSLPVVNPVRLG